MKPASSIQPPKQRRYATDDARCAAVLQRDAGADGLFVYAVKTTGVYCRPSCAARQPRRENVCFYATCAEAERAGFRACKRCQPNGPTLLDDHAARIAAACRLIESAETPPDLDALAKSAGMSRFHFHRVFTQIAGLTPKAYAKAKTAERVRQHLPKDESVTAAIYAAGYRSNGRFYAESTRLLGMRPQRYRAGGGGETIRFAVGESTLGAILAASSERGVCAILLGDDPEALLRDLQDRFPKARLIGGDREYERIVARVVGLVQAPGTALGLPLDIRGTAFQQRVWQALGEIPAGETATYSQVAERIGAPAAVRAVASACAANAHAVAIPCHRVVRRDGSLSGYRWGVERKRALLDMESAS